MIAIYAVVRLVLTGVERAVTGVVRASLIACARHFGWQAYHRRARALVDASAWDVFHAQDLDALTVAAWLSKRAGSPLVYDCSHLYWHNPSLSAVERRIWRRTEQRLVARASAVLAASHPIAFELEDRYGVEAPTVVLNYPPRAPAPDRQRLDALRARLGLDESTPPVVVYSGRFAPSEGLNELVEAAHYLGRTRILILGKGPQEAGLRRLIERMGVQDRVLLADPVSPAELEGLSEYLSVAVFLRSAVSDADRVSAPGDLLAYVSAGLPVVAGPLPEVNRLIEATGIGLTCDPRDPCDIAAAINYVLCTPHALDEMRRAAEVARRLASWESEERKLLAVYRPEPSHAWHSLSSPVS